VGDVHACSQELELLLDKVQPTRVVLLGDLFTKGPKALETWKLIRLWNMEAVRGNHDLALLEDPKRFYDLGLNEEAFNWLAALPLFIEEQNWCAVHAGVNPIHPEKTTMEEAVFLRRWPNDHSKEHPFWWQLYQGKRQIIYGHDARRKIQDHRPKTLGLDSGCVYGGELTGYLLEENRLISVKALAVYQPITLNTVEQKRK